MLTIRQSSVGSWHVIHEWHDTYMYLSCWLEDNLLSVPETFDPWMARYIPVLICHSWITCKEPTEDCLLVNMISTGMYHAIHGSHVSGTDRRLSVSDMWFMNGMIHTCTYHVDYKTIFCRFLTCDPWMAWYIPVLIMLTRRQSSVGFWHVIHEYMISTGMYHTIYGSHVRNRQKIVLYSTW
jgi:hypothetical protein